MNARGRFSGFQQGPYGVGPGCACAERTETQDSVSSGNIRSLLDIRTAHMSSSVASFAAPAMATSGSTYSTVLLQC